MNIMEGLSFTYNFGADYVGSNITSFATPIGGDAKVVLEAGDIIKCLSNTTSSIDIVLSYLEQT